MTYSVFFDSQALDFFGRLPTGDYQRMRDAIAALADNPQPPGCLYLIERNSWHLRVGKYRLAYQIDDAEQTVTILRLGQVRDTYE